MPLREVIKKAVFIDDVRLPVEANKLSAESLQAEFAHLARHLVQCLEEKWSDGSRISQ